MTHKQRLLILVFTMLLPKFAQSEIRDIGNGQFTVRTEAGEVVPFEQGRSSVVDTFIGLNDLPPKSGVHEDLNVDFKGPLNNWLTFLDGYSTGLAEKLRKAALSTDFLYTTRWLEFDVKAYPEEFLGIYIDLPTEGLPAVFKGGNIIVSIPQMNQITAHDGFTKEELQGFALLHECINSAFHDHLTDTSWKLDLGSLILTAKRRRMSEGQFLWQLKELFDAVQVSNYQDDLEKFYELRRVSIPKTPDGARALIDFKIQNNRIKEEIFEDSFLFESEKEIDFVLDLYSKTIFLPKNQRRKVFVQEIQGFLEPGTSRKTLIERLKNTLEKLRKEYLLFNPREENLISELAGVDFQGFDDRKSSKEVPLCTMTSQFEEVSLDGVTRNMQKNSSLFLNGEQIGFKAQFTAWELLKQLRQLTQSDQCRVDDFCTWKFMKKATTGATTFFKFEVFIEDVRVDEVSLLHPTQIIDYTRDLEKEGSCSYGYYLQKL